jgi:hypothetical protein
MNIVLHVGLLGTRKMHVPHHRFWTLRRSIIFLLNLLLQVVHGWLQWSHLKTLILGFLLQLQWALLNVLLNLCMRLLLPAKIYLKWSHTCKPKMHFCFLRKTSLKLSRFRTRTQLLWLLIFTYTIRRQLNMGTLMSLYLVLRHPPLSTNGNPPLMCKLFVS